ncbi:MAG: flagellar biosynthetic protein FliO [Pirellulaceae bacterium]
MRPIQPLGLLKRRASVSLLCGLTCFVAIGPAAQLCLGQDSGPTSRPAVYRPAQGSSLGASNLDVTGQPQSNSTNLRSTMPAPSWTGSTQPTHPQTSSSQVVQASFDSSPQSAGETNRIDKKPRIPIESRVSDEGSTTGSNSTLRMLFSMGSSLLIVVGLFLGVAWFYRKTMKTSFGGGLPKQVVNVLGRTQIAARQQLVLVRFGSKLVLVSLVQGEARTISEITDPLEVDQLAGVCESSQPGSISASFRSVLNQGSNAV